MRKQIFILTLIVTGFMFSPISFAQDAPLTAKEGTQIIIRGKSVNPPERPRTPVYNPFYAELTQLGVMLVADSDWGEASVTLSSLEGDYYQTTFDMADGTILLPVNGNDGDSYTLTISIESGLDFEGEFVL